MIFRWPLLYQESWELWLYY